MDDSEKDGGDGRYTGVVKVNKIACECGCEKTMKGEMKQILASVYMAIFNIHVRFTFVFGTDRAILFILAWVPFHALQL